MHAEVAHHTDFAARRILALPVDRLGRIEVAGMEEGRAHFERTPEFSLAGELEHALRSGQEREFRTAAHEAPEFFGARGNVPRGGEIDAERFFGQQVFARFQDIKIDLLVQLVRDGDVDRIDFRAGQQFAVVGGGQTQRRQSSEPIPCRWRKVANCGDFAAHPDILQRAPAADRRSHFAPHQAAADDAETQRAHLADRCLAACFAVAPSCTIAMSAATMPAGLACCTTLRP